jgi:hypothetical protein
MEMDQNERMPKIRWAKMNTTATVKNQPRIL